MSTTTAQPLMLSSAGQCACKHTLQRYVILHPSAMQLPHLKRSAYTRKLNATNSVTFANLTTTQADEIKNLITPLHGHIQLNKEHKHKSPAGTATKESAQSTAKTTYATAPVTCPSMTISSKLVLFFPDSMVDEANFPKVNLSFGTNYSGSDTPCDPHGDYTLSTFEQVLGDPKMSVTNIPVFTCNGTYTDENSINAMIDILNYKKANPTQNVGMYFAIEPALPNPTFTSVTQELVAAGILVGLSAGNNGQTVCNYNAPPQSVAGTFQVGATTPPGNQCPWWSNWSDIVPNSQSGDCVQAYLPGNFTSKQFKVNIQGTSFAIPQALGWAMRWWNQNQTATAAEVIQAFTNNTVIITKPPVTKPPSPPYTPTGQMRVVKTADYCNTNVSSAPRPN